jgi:hypothetical protein
LGQEFPVSEAFEFLPAGAVIEDKILCLHGGAQKVDAISQLPQLPSKVMSVWAKRRLGIEILKDIESSCMGRD